MEDNKIIITFLLLLCVQLQYSSGCPTDCNCLGTHVDCSDRDLTGIPSGIDATTTELDLSNNFITSLGSSLSHLQSLVSLNLNNNSITILDNQSLDSLTELNTVNLASNMISMLSTSSFNSQTKLEDLNLGDNQLEFLPDGLFSKTYQLKKLDLNQNRLTEDSLKVINTVNLAFLKELQLGGNFLLHLPYLGFNNLASLEKLSLVKSSTQSIDSNAFIGLKALILLDLSFNEMTSLRREIFQNIPKLSQLGIVGNPISCSCSIKQVQDFLTESTVTILIATTCVDADGVAHDIEHGDLNFLCPDKTTTPPSGTVAPWCGQNTTLELQLLEVDKDSALLQWDIKNGVLPSGADLRIYVRKAAEYEEKEIEIQITLPATPISINLDEASPYVVCIYQMDCKLRTCINFATDGYNEVGPLSLGESVGITSACFVVVIVVLLVAFGICLKRKYSNYSTADAQAVYDKGPEKAPINWSEDPYEDIPEKPKRRHANDSLPHPGQGTIPRPATLPSPPKQKFTASNQALQTKKDASPHNVEKQEHIAASANTKVFRRPNTMGSQELLADVPGLPPKSVAFSKSQELSKPHSTIIPIDFAHPILVPLQNSAENARNSHLYLEPDDLPSYEN